MSLSRRAFVSSLASGLAASALAPALLHAHNGVTPVSSAIPAIPADETFDGTWPFRARYSEAAGYRAHFIDEGAGPETLLLLHGEPTWSYLFRKQIKVWAERHRVIAIDHMGFGKSAAPKDRQYYLQDHIDNLERIVLALDLKNLTLVMHDFGGPAGMGLAIRHPDRIKRVISVNGPTPAGQRELVERFIASTAASPWFQWILKAEKEGVLEQVLGQLGYNILSTLKLNGFEDNSIITDAWLKAYGAPFPTPAHAAGAIGWAKGYATGAHKFEMPDTAMKRALASKPALAVWGMKDHTLNGEHFLPLFAEAFPEGRVQKLPNAGHYSPEDAPDEVARLVGTFVSGT